VQPEYTKIRWALREAFNEHPYRLRSFVERSNVDEQLRNEVLNYSGQHKSRHGMKMKDICEPATHLSLKISVSSKASFVLAFIFFYSFATAISQFRSKPEDKNPPNPKTKTTTFPSA
jgi:hypothetical protein